MTEKASLEQISTEVVEECAVCGKLVSDQEYVVNWASCAECFGKHVDAYFNGPTPGPWAAQPMDMFGDITISGPEDSRAVAAVISNLREPGQIIANARQIAATPEMVDLLQWIACFAQMRSEDDSKVFARVNRGALRTIAEKATVMLAKVRGRELAAQDAAQ